MSTLANRRPVLFALLVMLALQVFVMGALLISRTMDVPLLSLDLPILLLNGVLAAILLSLLGWWRAAGFNPPAEWRNLHFLLVPILLLLLPAYFLLPNSPASVNWVGLAVVTLLIGFQEEAIFRGVLLRAFLPRGAMQAVLISAALFSVIHANSFLVGRDTLFVIAQIIASFLGAIGLGALRVRMNTIWPLILLHALNDFIQFMATGGLEAQEVAIYIPVAKIVISALMAIYGLYLLRVHGRATVEPAASTA